MNPNESAIESLLKQMRLAEPTSELDRKIGDLVASEPLELPLVADTVGHYRFGWNVLAATAVAASLFGLIVGQFVTIYPGPKYSDSRPRTEGVLESGVGNSEQLNAGRSRKITPVKFDVGAFKILHGHSQEPAFANCAACHLSGEPEQEAFAGWYYGNDRFFKKHYFEGVANCSACHVLTNPRRISGPGSADLELPSPHGLSRGFLNRDCSDCHAVSPG